MAQNKLPAAPAALAVLAGKCQVGLAKYEVPLNITQITAASLGADTTTLTAAIGTFNTSRVNRTAAHATLITASNAARDFLLDGRKLLAIQWGDTWNTQWAEAGWTDHSTAVPNTQPDRIKVLDAIAEFLTANPAYEVVQVPPKQPITFTAAQAEAVSGAFTGALAAVASADTAGDTALDARAAADLVVRKDVRVLIGILSQKLTSNDPRWEEFGLNAPGKAVTPKAPTHLQNHPALPGQVLLTCDVPPGTDHLRWWMKTASAPKYSNVEDTADGELLLMGQTTGQTLDFYVTAVNPAGESVPSGAVVLTVG